MSHAATRQPSPPQRSTRSADMSMPSPARQRPARFARPLFAALALCFVLDPSLPAHAQLPTGPAVVHGTAAIGTAGTQMTVTNSPSAILNWQSFSIGAQHGVRFQQQSAASKVLNRVTGSDPSQILGSLSSNGQVWLINPHGVLFGQNARIDVAGLVASTLDISNTDFLANRFSFATAGGAVGGEVLNQGELRTSFGGRVWLLGEQVRNEGLIASPGGNIVLAAGKSIELIDSGMPNVIVRVSAPENETVNLGTLVADGGSVDLHGGIVNQNGIVRADSVGSDALGRIVLKASQTVNLGESSQTLAGGKRGGRVLVEAGAGSAMVAGRVSARGENGAGGQIHVLGPQVGVFGQAVLDASGATGGGEILVGGDYQGRNPALRNARATFIGADARLAANALAGGNGGRVIVWSDKVTRAYGTLAARGGPAWGNGGFIETSGGWLDARPMRIDLAAPRGIAGTWLLDPNDITISNLTPQNITGGPVFTSTDDSAVVNAATIESILSAGTNVIIQTGTNGANTQDGNITVDANVVANGAAPGSFTLSAHNNIVVNPNVAITSTSGPMEVTFISDSDGNLSGGISMLSGSSITTRGGNIAFRGGGADAAAVGSPGNAGIAFSFVTLDATLGGVGVVGSVGDGNIDLKGIGSDSGGAGVIIANTSSLFADRIAIDGLAKSTDSGMMGVYVTSNSDLTARTIQISGSSGSILNGAGILINSSAALSALASIDLNGTGLSRAGDGVRIESNASLDADRIVIDGFAQSTDPGWAGVVLQSGAFLSGRDIRVSGQTNSIDNGSPLGKYWSTLIDASTIYASSGGNLLIQGLDGYVGIDRGSRVVADGTTPITIAARVPDIFQSDIGEPSEDTYSGDITFRGEWVILDNRGEPGGGPTIQTSGQVSFRPLADVGDLVVGLEAATFGSSISQILIGDANTRDLYFHNSNGLDPSAGPISVDSPVTFSATRNTFFGYAPAGAPAAYLNSGIISNAPGDAITVVTGVFDNRAGANALSAPEGRWLVYAADPATSNEGFSGYNKHYDQPFSAGSAPAYADSGNWFLYSIAPTLAVTPGAQSITYGDAVPPISAADITGFIDGDLAATGGISGSAAWAVSGTSSASGNLVAGAHDVSYTSGLASNLGYRFADNAASNSELTVNARPLDASLTGTVSKVYDGSTAAPLAAQNVSLSGLYAGDNVAASSSDAAYDNRNVGVGKTVTVSTLALTGSDAANYYYLGSATLAADIGTITPATLSYVADPATRQAGLAVTGLSGTVAGFVGSDTAANATSGVLAWWTPATTLSPAGRYAVNGDGLSAANYVFVQSPGNATALTLQMSNEVEVDLQTLPKISVNTLDTGLQLAFPRLDPGTGKLIDATSALAPSFAPLDLSFMNRDEMQQLLDDREEFKKKLFADAIYKLEQDPSLADVRPCQSAADANSGLCILTAEQRGAAQAQTAPKQMHRTKIARLPQIERKIAVLIGINDYTDKSIPSLENAIPDAEVVSELLAANLGYEVRVVKNATKVDIVRALNQLSTEVGPRDSVIIYYAGHGYQLEKSGAGYWLPADSSPKDPLRWMSNTDVAKMLSGIGASQLALISDSCYSGAFTREQKVDIVAKTLVPAEVLSRRSVVVMSSGGDEPVADEGKGGHSIFAWHLMQNIRQVDDWQPGTTIFEQVQRDVHKSFPQTPQYGAASSAGHQGGDYLFEFRQLEDVQ